MSNRTTVCLHVISAKSQSSFAVADYVDELQFDSFLSASHSANDEDFAGCDPEARRRLEADLDSDWGPVSGFRSGLCFG